MKPAQVLWRTVVGSHMWRMNRPDSDLDYYTAYAVDPRLFFVGDNVYKAHKPDRTGGDEMQFEIRAVVEQVWKGNLNHLWGVLSPIAVIEGPERQALQAILRANPAKGVYHSTKGMVEHNLYHLPKQSASRQIKTRNSIARSIAFARSLIAGEPCFDPIPEPPTMEAIGDDLALLTREYIASPLPDRADLDPFVHFTSQFYTAHFLRLAEEDPMFCVPEEALPQ